MPSSATSRRVELIVAVIAIAVGAAFVVSAVVTTGDISGLIRFGEGPGSVEIVAHAEDVLGRDVAKVPKEGHDGKFFFVQALDPLYLSPDTHAVHLDRPVYRAQRMLFPLIAGVGGLLPAEATMWSMALVNITALALGTIGTARLAQRFGGTPWLGLAFTLNPGMMFELDLSGAGVIAFACAIWGTLALIEQRHRQAIAWFIAAVLAREVMLLYLAGVCCHQLWTNRRIPWLLGAIPFSTVVAWGLYLRLRLDAGTGVDEVQEFGIPFGGILDAYPNWIDEPANFAMIAGLLIVMPLLIVRAVQRPNPLAWGALGFVVLAVLMTRQVWWNGYDMTRAIAPVFSAYIVTTFASPGETRSAELVRADGPNESAAAT